MSEFLTGFDLLALGALLAALALLGAVVWVLVDDRPLEDLDRRRARSAKTPPENRPERPKPPATTSATGRGGRGARAA